MTKRKNSAGKKTARSSAHSSSKQKKTGGKKAISREHRTKRTLARESSRKKGELSATHAAAEKAYRKYGNGILDKLGPYGVIGISFGPRFMNGEPTSEMTIRLHVATDEAKRYLKKNAKKIGFTKTYGGVGTDIVVWDFQTSSSGQPAARRGLPDGTRIEGNGGFGTLGTKIIIEVDGRRRARWITAAHVASRTIEAPSQPVPITLSPGGQKIGTVSKGEYFRDGFVDVAFITPTARLSARTRARGFAPLTSGDKNAIVTMKGAVTSDVPGKIILLDFDGTVKSPVGMEEVANHFLVQGLHSKNFADKGDSGAIVFKQNTLIGIVRAADKNSGIAVVTQLDVVAEKAMEFKL